MPRIWRVVPRTDTLGNQLWSLQYDPMFSGEDGDVTYGLWREDRVFRNEERANKDLEHARRME